MECRGTSAKVYGGYGILGTSQLLPFATTVPEECAEKYEKKDSASANSDASNSSIAQPRGVQFSYQFHDIKRL